MFYMYALVCVYSKQIKVYLVLSMEILIESRLFLVYFIFEDL